MDGRIPRHSEIPAWVRRFGDDICEMGEVLERWRNCAQPIVDEHHVAGLAGLAELEALTDLLVLWSDLRRIDPSPLAEFRRLVLALALDLRGIRTHSGGAKRGLPGFGPPPSRPALEAAFRTALEFLDRATMLLSASA